MTEENDLNNDQNNNQNNFQKNSSKDDDLEERVGKSTYNSDLNKEINYERSSYETKTGSSYLDDKDDLARQEASKGISSRADKLIFNMEFSEQLGYKYSPVMKKIYSVLGTYTSFDKFKQDSDKRISSLHADEDRLSKNISSLFESLYGSVHYDSRFEGESYAQFVNRHNQIPDSKKSLAYKINYYSEWVDFIKEAGENLRSEFSDLSNKKELYILDLKDSSTSASERSKLRLLIRGLEREELLKQNNASRLALDLKKVSTTLNLYSKELKSKEIQLENLNESLFELQSEINIYDSISDMYSNSESVYDIFDLMKGLSTNVYVLSNATSLLEDKIIRNDKLSKSSIGQFKSKSNTSNLDSYFNKSGSAGMSGFDKLNKAFDDLGLDY